VVSAPQLSESPVPGHRHGLNPRIAQRFLHKLMAFVFGAQVHVTAANSLDLTFWRMRSTV
jgi:hypothetical protein